MNNKHLPIDLTNFTGKDFKHYRKQAKLTQQQLADLIGVSRDTLVKIEKIDTNLIETVKFATLRDFWQICAKRMPSKSRQTLKKALLISIAKVFNYS